MSGLRRTSPPVLRAAWWALRALRSVRAELANAGQALAVRVDVPPAALPKGAVRGVTGTLRRRNATCLERALVLQAWHAAHGERYEVVIGVTAPNGDFQAHAWLEGVEPQDPAGPFRELVRLPPPGAGHTGGHPVPVHGEQPAD